MVVEYVQQKEERSEGPACSGICEHGAPTGLVSKMPVAGYSMLRYQGSRVQRFTVQGSAVGFTSRQLPCLKILKMLDFLFFQPLNREPLNLYSYKSGYKT
jgi:hypothetical protein